MKNTVKIVDVTFNGKKYPFSWSAGAMIGVEDRLGISMMDMANHMTIKLMGSILVESINSAYIQQGVEDRVNYDILHFLSEDGIPLVTNAMAATKEPEAKEGKK